MTKPTKKQQAYWEMYGCWPCPVPGYMTENEVCVKAGLKVKNNVHLILFHALYIAKAVAGCISKEHPIYMELDGQKYVSEEEGELLIQAIKQSKEQRGAIENQRWWEMKKVGDLRHNYFYRVDHNLGYKRKPPIPFWTGDYDYLVYALQRELEDALEDHDMRFVSKLKGWIDEFAEWHSKTYDLEKGPQKKEVLHLDTEWNMKGKFLKSSCKVFPSYIHRTKGCPVILRLLENGCSQLRVWGDEILENIPFILNRREFHLMAWRDGYVADLDRETTAHVMSFLEGEELYMAGV